MAPVDHRIISRALIAGLVVAAVGLSGCGRKGALEAPPYATLKSDTGVPNPNLAPKPKKKFFLDPLL